MPSVTPTLLWAGIIMEAGCAALTLTAGGEGGRRVFIFLLIMLLMGLVYLAASWRAAGGRIKGRADLPVIVLFAVLFYLTLLGGKPLFDNDIYRFLWDGKVTVEGINPYRYAPADRALAHLRDPAHSLIGYPQLPTPYPPASQVIFAVMRVISGGSLFAARAFLGIFFFASIWITVLLLDLAGKDRRLVLLYAWNPLVLKEFANSGHIEPVVVFFSLVSVYLLFRGRDSLSGAALALAALTKFYPLFAAPFLFWRSRRKHLFAAGFAAAAVIMYAPFLGVGMKVFGSMGTYLKYWLFNHGFFGLWQWTAGLVMGESGDTAARWAFWVLAAAAAIFVGRHARNDEAENFCRKLGFFLFFLVVLSPTVMPWYVVWSLPLLVFRPFISVLGFSILVNASYIYYFGRQDIVAVRWTEHLLLLFLLLLDWRALRRGQNKRGRT